MGFLTKLGKTLIINDGNEEDVVSDLGDASMSSRGGMLHDSNVSKIGEDTFYCNGKTYTRIGNTVICSDGRSWQGIGELSDSEVRGVILHNTYSK